MESVSSYSDWRPERIPAGWHELDMERRAAVNAELATEIADGHPMFGQTLTPVAGCIGCDETLVFIEDETQWAMVHPTWRSAPEPPPWPDCEVFDAKMPIEQMAAHADHVDTTRGRTL